MILLILLQVVGFEGFKEEVQSASIALRLPMPKVYVQAVDPQYPRRMAWTYICPVKSGCTPAVYLASDVAAIAPRRVLRYYAYHEVCHLKLGHTSYEWADRDRTLADTQVRTCMEKVLSPSEATKLEMEMMAFGYGKLLPIRREKHLVQ